MKYALVSAIKRAIVQRGPLNSIGLSDYAANDLDPAFVMDFSAAGADYFRTGGADAVFTDVATTDSEAGGLAVMRDSSGNAVWNPHNALTHSEQFDNSAWNSTVGGIGGGLAPVVTANAGTAPDGTTTADRVVFDLDGNTTVTDQSRLLQNVTASQATFAVWIKAFDGVSEYDMQIVTSAGTTDCAVTGSWQAFEISRADITNVQIKVRGGQTPTNSDVADVLLWGAHAYRSDLGGMADVPSDERGLSSSTTYVPTTTAVRYLLRRRSHYYDGSSWLPTLDLEPEAATNDEPESRDFSTWSGTASIVKNSTGIDGVANSAYTVSDTGSGFQPITNNYAVTSDTARRGGAIFLKKTSSASSFPAVACRYGSGAALGVAVNTDTGVATPRSTFEPDSYFVEDWGTHWRVSVFVDNASETSFDFFLYAAVNTDASGTWDTGISGSVEADQADIYLTAGTSVPSSPIITSGASVTRAADTLKAKASALPYSSTAISFLMEGRGNFGSNTERLFSWRENLNDRIELFLNGVNRTPVTQIREGGGTLEQAFTADLGSTAVDQDFRLAVRANGGDSLQIASVGVAGSAESGTMPATMPAISATDTTIGDVGGGGDPVPGLKVRVISVWGEDIGEAGIEEATA